MSVTAQPRPCGVPIPHQTALLVALSENDHGLTVDELSVALGISTDEIRAILTRLVESGIVRSHPGMAPAHGRADYRYILVEDPISLYGVLAEVLLSSVAALDEQFARTSTAGQTIGAARVHGRFPRSVIDQTARMGFAPRDQTTQADFVDAVTRIRMENCPVRSSVTGTNGHLVCRIHEEIVRGACTTGGGRLLEFAPAPPEARACEFTIADARSSIARASATPPKAS